VHGTTVALNALLTGSIAQVALVTNQGFGDLLEIGRQERPEIYALHPRKQPALVPEERRFEIASRAWPAPGGGRLVQVQSVGERELARLRRAIARSGATSIAVCLLHSYAEPALEERVARALAPLGLPITCSAQVLREHREYERFSSAVVNAALVPLMRDYLGALGPALSGARLSLLQSSGGTLAAAECAASPVRVLFSGPAGGVVGAAQAAAEAGFSDFVGLDLGGTSTDVAFHGQAWHAGGGAEQTLEPVRIAGHPVAVPALDIHTIGCGGGSLVRRDPGGILHVGPESAGAEPGPVAYGRSEALTLTDAHVLLGQLGTGAFLGGALALDEAAVRRAFARLARGLGAAPAEAARAVLDVARAGMRRAIGVMTMQRGVDPARLPLVAFGGAGGLHACALAASLGMRGALVPLHPGALSARGMTAAEPRRDLEHTLLRPLAELGARRRARLFAELVERARDELRSERVAARSIALELSLDLRYQGQSFELRVPEGRDPERAFHRAHRALYGYALEDRAVELVCLRVRAAARARPPRRRSVRAHSLPGAAVRESRTIHFDRPRRTRVIERAALPPGCTFAGPARIEEYSGTTLVPPGWMARVTAHGHLWLTRA
jgi:N-methylhydantoinase A